MPQTVLIGKGRRVTLDELKAVCLQDGELEIHITTEANPENLSSGVDNDSLTAALSNLSLEESGDALTPSATLAALTLLALAISQNRILPTSSTMNLETTMAIIDLVNFIKSSSSPSFVLPASASEFLAKLSTLIGSSACVQSHLATSLAPHLTPSLQNRILPLAITALSTTQLHTLTKSSTIDALASLSVERTSTDCLGFYSDTNFDLNRPHRGMISSAAVLRACTQGSKFAIKKKGNDDNDAVQITERTKAAVESIAQMHGPCADVLVTASKVLELECNCFDVNPKQTLDPTVVEMTASTVRNAALTLLDGSLARNGKKPDESTVGNGTMTVLELALNLEGIVSNLQTSLMEETRLNITFIESEIQKATDLATKKAEEKAARAAAHGNKNKKEDNFDGLTEAQKAKILKKRAEKEAKAAKKKAKQGGAAAGGNGAGQAAQVSIFGAAIPPIVSAIKKSNYQLTDSCIDEIEALVSAFMSGGVQRKPKIAKGTRDYLPEQMMIRDQAFQIIRRVFKSHGAVEIDTPVFELKDTLTGKYGEDSKLIYDLADQGGELLALRYDLTVPFARFLALNAVGNIKRFHIGKVYRRDQPQLSKGRYREFYQCDFDIAGTYGRMVPDSECLCVACEILASLPIGDFGIKLNHRRLLDAILDLCGVPADKFRTICSAVDKLDKEPWSEVKREMVEDKGLESEVADKIGVFVLQKGKPWDMYKSLTESKVFGEHKGANDALEDLRLLFEFLEAMDKLQYISFDLSLARGLDYYTGVIYEAVCMNGNTQVGSIGGGGRYDNLVSMFQEAGKVTPCVGVSVGIERVFTLMEERIRQEQGGSIKQPNVTVLVAQAGENMMLERMKMAKILWDSNISAEFSQQENPKLKFEIANALDRNIPFMVIIGEEEAKENKCKLKDLKARTEETVDQSQLVSTLRQKGVVPVGCEFAAEMLAIENEK